MREYLQRWWRSLTAPRMLYGWRRADGIWLAHTRISNATRIENPQRLDIADHVYIGPFNLVDASGGLQIGEGVQVTTHCVLLTHSSHRAVRLAGRRYWGASQPAGYLSAPTVIGAYSFIGAHSVVAPGSRIGAGRGRGGRPAGRGGAHRHQGQASPRGGPAADHQWDEP